MFGAVLVLVYSVMLAYVSWRAWSVPCVARHLSPGLFLAIVALVWLPFAAARLAGHGAVHRLPAGIEQLGMTLLGSVFIITVAMLSLDIATGFGWFFPGRVPHIRGWALVTGGLLSVFAVIQGHRAPAVVSYEAYLPGLPEKLDGTVLVALSDAHLGGQQDEKWMDARVRQVEAEKPDILVFLGDMFEGHGGAPDDIPSLGRLSVPMGKWYVTGNHESHGGGGEGARALERAGFRRLADAHVPLARGMVLAGVNDLTRHSRSGGRTDPLSVALANRPRGATILLSHTPWQADRAARAGVGLMLSGHTHGGQIWPFGFLVRRAYPLLAGFYEVDGMAVIVSRGAGTWGPRMRLWRRGEITKVILHQHKRTT